MKSQTRARLLEIFLFMFGKCLGFGIPLEIVKHAHCCKLMSTMERWKGKQEAAEDILSGFHRAFEMNDNVRESKGYTRLLGTFSVNVR